MKHLRIEVHFTVKAFVGEDISADEAPPLNRYPEAVQLTTITRTVGLGSQVQARDAAAGHLVSIFANAAPVLAEQVAHALRTKGF